MLGHELTHIRNGDVRMMVIAVIIAGVVSFFAELVFRLWFYNGFSFRGRSDDRRGGGAGLRHPDRGCGHCGGLFPVVRHSAGAVAFPGILADAGSVELTKNPDAMISALRKIEGRGELPGATSAVMEMCLDNPRQGFGELFDTHPSVDSRVAALVKFAGGHDPGPLSLPPQASDADEDQSEPPPPSGPWGPAVDKSSEAEGASPGSPDSSAGPWGPHTGSA